jgi:hypothetical protein
MLSSQYVKEILQILVPRKIMVRINDEDSFVTTTRYAGILERSVIWIAPEKQLHAGQSPGFSSSEEQ